MPEQFYKGCLSANEGHTTQYNTKQHNSFVSVRIQNIISVSGSLHQSFSICTIIIMQRLGTWQSTTQQKKPTIS